MKVTWDPQEERIPPNANDVRVFFQSLFNEYFFDTLKTDQTGKNTVLPGRISFFICVYSDCPLCFSDCYRRNEEVYFLLTHYSSVAELKIPPTVWDNCWHHSHGVFSLLCSSRQYWNFNTKPFTREENVSKAFKDVFLVDFSPKNWKPWQWCDHLAGQGFLLTMSNNHAIVAMESNALIENSISGIPTRYIADSLSICENCINKNSSQPCASDEKTREFCPMAKIKEFFNALLDNRLFLADLDALKKKKSCPLNTET